MNVEAFAALSGASPTAGSIGAVLGDIEIAEDAIAAAGLTPETDGGVFMQMRRPALLRSAPLWLYKAHCRELAERVAAGGPSTNLGTMAEVVLMMSHTSLDAPLNALGLLVSWHALKSVAPEQAAGIWPPGDTPREQWPGQLEEELLAVQKRVGAARGL